MYEYGKDVMRGADMTNQGMPRVNEQIWEEFERERYNDPVWVLAGSIVMSGGRLRTNEDRFYHLVASIKSGDFDYKPPESVDQIISSLEIYPKDHYYVSEKIENMFSFLSTRDGIYIWYSHQNGHQVTEYELGQDGQSLYDFMDHWADDEEALEFFVKCAEYLDLKREEPADD